MQFGIAVDELEPLLREAAAIGANIVGVSCWFLPQPSFF